MLSLTREEQLANAFEEGYMHAKMDTYEARAEQTLIYKRGLEMIIELAAKRGDWEVLAYARQTLRRLR